MKQSIIQNPDTRKQVPETKKRRGQSVVEMALILPLLVLLLAIIIDAGLAISAWLRVTSAARDATRFTMDAGRPADTASLVLNKLAGIEFGTSGTYTLSTEINIYVITGTTNSTGAISVWAPTHIYGAAPSNDPNYPRVQRSVIQQRLASVGPEPNRNMPFTIVEVDYNYTPIIASLIAPYTRLPMTGFAIVHQYDY